MGKPSTLRDTAVTDPGFELLGDNSRIGRHPENGDLENSGRLVLGRTETSRGISHIVSDNCPFGTAILLAALRRSSQNWPARNLQNSSAEFLQKSP